jgi:hypothetical protein
MRDTTAFVVIPIAKAQQSSVESEHAESQESSMSNSSEPFSALALPSSYLASTDVISVKADHLCASSVPAVRIGSLHPGSTLGNWTMEDASSSQHRGFC